MYENYKEEATLALRSCDSSIHSRYVLTSFRRFCQTSGAILGKLQAGQCMHMYMPMMHSENEDDHGLCVDALTRLLAEVE